MHRDEGDALRDPRWASDIAAALSLSPVLGCGSALRMWNAGVVGLHWRNAERLHRATCCLDQVYDRTRWRLAEQLAVGAVLQEGGLRAADDIVIHYWNQQRPFNLLRAEFETYNTAPQPEQVRALQSLLGRFVQAERKRPK
jgi:hypothetical protein